VRRPLADGVVVIGVAQEKMRAFKAHKRSGRQGGVTFDFSRQSVAVNHDYFYLRDPDRGPTSIEAISRDGKRLLISRRDCAMDCKDVRVGYFELTLP